MRIVLDLDDVLCNFVGAWNQWLFDKGYTETILSRTEIGTYDFYQQFGKEVNDFYLKEPDNSYENLITPFDGSHEFVDWCRSNFDDVMVLSHSASQKTMRAKARFVKTHFDLENIRFSDTKTEKYTFTKGAVLVDDYPYNVLKHVAHNDDYGICFNIKNENGWTTLTNHSDLIQELNPDLGKVWTTSSYFTTKYLLKNLKDAL